MASGAANRHRDDERRAEISRSSRDGLFHAFRRQPAIGGKPGAFAKMSVEPDDLVKFNSALNACDSMEACAALFGATIASYGFNTFACGELDLAERDRKVFYIIAWPDSWRQFYMASGLYEHDPIVGGLAYRSEPFTWTELRADRQLPKLGSKALQLAAEHGFKEGLVVPVPRGGQRTGIVSLVGPDPRMTPRERSFLSLLSILLHHRARHLAPKARLPIPPMGLTARELDCLSLIARGMSDRDIGQELGISASTAHEYVEGAKRKMLVKTRAAAVGIATGFGLLVA